MKYKLSNLVFSGIPSLANHPLLAFRCEKGVCFSGKPNCLKIAADSAIDFTTYFGSLSINKWLKYSIVDNFNLHFEYRGSAFSFEERAASNFDWESVSVPGSLREFASSTVWASVDIDLKVDPSEVLHSFALMNSEQLEIKNAYFYTEIDESLLQPVELSLVITTFKKEKYVINNLNLIESQLLESDEEVADHLSVHVIDNGRSLDFASSDSKKIKIHPNPNVGGSGGFARGMIESIEQDPKATHVLLMDDDVEVLPESFLRTYSLLRVLKPEFSSSFVSGAMMSLEEPNIRTEDLGFFTEKGTFSPLKPQGDMTCLHDVIETEIYRAPIELYPDTAQQYAGWWYCVIPTAMIERFGLPLPLFVRSDDAEYALRCKASLISMNGICVWHNSFKYKYSAAVERYQVSRNTLISQATTGIAPLSDFLYEIRREVELDLKKFNYEDAALAVKGLEDFLRGPEWISHPVAEKRFMEANKEREKLIPIEDLLNKAISLGIDLSQLTHGNLSLGGSRSSLEALKDYITVNGQRFVNDSARRKHKVAVIDAAGWVYPAGKIRDVDTIIVVDMPNKKGAIRHMDRHRFDEVWTRYLRAERIFKKNKAKLYAEYSLYRDTFTSIGFWKKYLREAAEA